MRRQNEEDDAIFYAEPRLVGHVDARASDFLTQEYDRRIGSGAKVLDLMSSVQSHLPDNRGLVVTGLGLNDGEMRSNPQLVERVVRDLNREPELPFGEGAFGAVACSLSFEYLTRPAEVVAEVSRVLKPGGIFLVGLSNRWFPPKVTRIWTLLHEFERMGLVLEHLHAGGTFTDLRTFSVRGWPRPVEDAHYPQLRTSDPVYVVSGVKGR